MIILQYLLMIATFFAAAITIRLLPDDYYETKENKSIYEKHGINLSRLVFSFSFTLFSWKKFKNNSFVLFMVSGLIFLLLCILHIFQLDIGISIFHAFIIIVSMDFIAMIIIMRLSGKRQKAA